MELQVSSLGIRTKSPPSGLGLYGAGGWLGPTYQDRYGSQRTLTPAQVIIQFRNVVYICVQKNANAMMRVPIKLYVQTGRGDPRPKCRVRGLTNRQQDWIRRKSNSSVSGRIAGDSDVEEVTDHPFLDLLANPNPYFGAAFCLKVTAAYEDIVGNAYWYTGDRNRLGVPYELWPLPAHQVWPVRNPDDEQLISYWAFATARGMAKLDPKDVVHFHDFNQYEPYSLGTSPLMAMIEVVTETEQIHGHMQALLDNEARPDAILSPAEMIGEPEQRRLEAKLNQKFRGRGFGGIMVTESPMELKPLGWSPLDLGIIEFFATNRDLVCNAYDVPLTMLQTSAARAERDSARAQHAEDAVLPRCVRRDEVINRQLMPLYDDSGRLFVCSDNPVPEDEEFKLKSRIAGVTGGWQKRSEARAESGLEAEDWADKPTLPSSQQILDDDGTPIQQEQPMGRVDGDGNIFGARNGQRKPASNGDSRSGGSSSGTPGTSGKSAASPAVSAVAKQQPVGVDAKGALADGDSERGALLHTVPDVSRPASATAGEPADHRAGLVKEVADLCRQVESGTLSRTAALSAVRQAYGLNAAEAEDLIADPRTMLRRRLDFALAELPDARADDATERKFLDLYNTKGKHDHLEWTEPDLGKKKVQTNIARAAKQLADEGVQIDADELTALLKDGELVKLKDKAWGKIQNTESLEVKKFRDVFDIAHRQKKKVRPIMEEFILDRIGAPIVLSLPGGGNWLVTGNTRLCIAKLFGIRPYVWLAELPDDYTKALEWQGKSLRKKNLQAALALLDSLPAVDQQEYGGECVPVPFKVDSPGIQPTDAQRAAAVPQTVKLADLCATCPSVSRSSVLYCLKPDEGYIGQRELPVIWISQDGDLYIASGLDMLTACVLLGATEAEVRLVDVREPSDGSK